MEPSCREIFFPTQNVCLSEQLICATTKDDRRLGDMVAVPPRACGHC